MFQSAGPARIDASAGGMTAVPEVEKRFAISRKWHSNSVGFSRYTRVGANAACRLK